MRKIWVDFGTLSMSDDAVIELLPLVYLLEHTADATVCAVSADQAQIPYVKAALQRNEIKIPVFDGTDAVAELANAAKEAPLSVLLLDGFKLINDVVNLEGSQIQSQFQPLIAVNRSLMPSVPAKQIDLHHVVFFTNSQCITILTAPVTQGTSCCDSDTSQEETESSISHLGLTAAIYFLHPDWFENQTYVEKAGQYPIATEFENFEKLSPCVTKCLQSLDIPAEKCPCRGTYLDKLVQPAILIVLTEGPSHGFQIIQRLNERNLLSGESLDATGLYRTLKRLEKSGHLTSHWDTDAPKAKRIFTITPMGRICLANWRQALQEYDGYINYMIMQIDDAFDVPYAAL